MLRPFEQFKLKHLFVFLTIAFAVQGCLSTKLIPENKHLLKKNKIKVEGDKISKSEVEELDKIDLDLYDNKKTQSQRLRSVLYLNWQKDNKGFSEFKDYYTHLTNQIIEFYKTKLE